MDALVTNSGKGQDTFADGAAAHLLCQLLRRVDIVNVDHRAAMGANEMSVRHGAAVKALRPVHDPRRGEDPLLLEGGEVTVDRAEGEIGDLRRKLQRM